MSKVEFAHQKKNAEMEIFVFFALKLLYGKLSSHIKFSS